MREVEISAKGENLERVLDALSLRLHKERPVLGYEQKWKEQALEAQEEARAAFALAKQHEMQAQELAKKYKMAEALAELYKKQLDREKQKQEQE
jgi:hypothetical protein